MENRKIVRGRAREPEERRARIVSAAREEAQVAGVSVSYYTHLEQG